MLGGSVTALAPKPGGRCVDGTIGGGHARRELAGEHANGWLSGCDPRWRALEAAETAAEFGYRFELKRGNFSDLADWIEPRVAMGCCWIW
jgi:16S rRNA (cytosine1402-N4)-methyltransferase